MERVESGAADGDTSVSVAADGDTIVAVAGDGDTIVAVSTPPGRGGIGVVRLSGPLAVGVASGMVRLKRPLEHARAVVAEIVEAAAEAREGPVARTTQVPEAGPGAPGIAAPGVAAPGVAALASGAGRVLDEAVVTAFLGPRSYTGEDVVEIAAHGSPVVLEAVVRAALRRGARLAEPGEFTRRAFLAGRLDLTQAEAVHDLIAAQTLEQARVAAQQMGGALRRQVAPAKERLLTLIALLEAGMDFASGELDDVEVVAPAEIAAAIAAAEDPLAALLAGFARGQMLREGVSLALVGRPNAGKSSLFNRLLERERAIVTAAPGTTRDTVEETLAMAGIPVRLVDTAGLRLLDEAVDEAERMGMQRSREALADAGLVLLVHDAAAPWSEEEQALLEELAGRPVVVVWNKVDLVDSSASSPASSTAHPSRQLLRDEWGTRVFTSAVTGAGMEALRGAVLRALQADGAVAEGAVLGNLRQQQAVAAAVEALRAAGGANAAGMPHEAVLIDLHAALQALDALTGATTTEDILGRIFAAFCVGK